MYNYDTLWWNEWHDWGKSPALQKAKIIELFEGLMSFEMPIFLLDIGHLVIG